MKKDYTISSAGLTSTTLTAATVGDRTFATFVADTIDKSRTNEETISGKYCFKFNEPDGLNWPVSAGADNRTDALRTDPPTDRPFNG